MKPIISATIILAILFTSSFLVSMKQRNTLVPIQKEVDTLLSITDTTSHTRLLKCIHSMESNRFTIELGLPGDDFDKIYYLLKSALRLLNANDKALYQEKLEECKIYLESLTEYSRVNFASIL